MVAVAYRRWSFTRSSNCMSLTGKVLVFWIGGRLWEVVAYERWSHMEVRPHFLMVFHKLASEKTNFSLRDRSFLWRGGGGFDG